MKKILRTFFFHIICITIFSIIYYNFSDEFHVIDQEGKGFVEYLLLSTTIQSGVGIAELYPLSFFSKILVIIQQILMLFTHIITIYIFTI